MSRPQKSQRSTYDPFGERIDAPRAAALPARRRSAGRAQVALFWAVALMLLAGRAYLPVHAPAAPAVAQQASLR